MPRSEPEGPSELHFMLCCPEFVQHWALRHHLSQNQELCLGHHSATQETFPFGASILGFQQKPPYPRGLEERDGTRSPRAVLAS